MIADKTGFASIVKACSNEFVKFGIIGIATSVSELIKEHSSIGRQIDIIHVGLMPEGELHEILNRAEHKVQRVITFEQNVAGLISQKSEGFPYFTHLLGKESMLSSYRRSSTRIEDYDINTVSEKIATGRLKTIFEDLYHQAVKHSPQREMLLKIFSEQQEDDINTVKVYALATELEISNPAQLMKQLTNPDTPDTPAVLIKTRERHYRFTDPVFKAYARLRNWKFS